MEREKAIESLIVLQRVSDTECAHIEADEVLCELLKSLGFGDVVEEYNKVHKWYA